MDMHLHSYFTTKGTSQRNMKTLILISSYLVDGEVVENKSFVVLRAPAVISKSYLTTSHTIWEQ